MAVSKLWSVTSRLGQVIDYAANPEKTATDIYTEEQYQALRDVLSYAKDEEKTEREFFVEGINCNPATARDQFVSVKKAYGKDDGIQAYHGYLSFKEQDISPELAQKIGMEFANEVWGKRFQVVVTTHLNTKHLHCHYVINSVSFVDGKRLWGDEKAWFKFRLVADRLCEKYGLYYNPNPNRSKQSSYYYKQEQAGMPSRYSITRDAIDEAIAHSTNLKTFDYMQNANRPIDLDYNLEITRIDDWEDCRNIKECVRKAFNTVLRKHGWNDCEDSTSSLTTEKRCFTQGNDTDFSIDVCIVCEDVDGNYHRLIHEKTGFSYYDKYFWNQAPNSRRLKEKADYIKSKGKWALVREQYKRIKNKYLTSNDYNHSSFICYIEAVNNVYNSRKHWD